MTTEEILAELEWTEGATVEAGADAKILERLGGHVGLPTAHVDLLKIANGISVFGGYFRLFGGRCPEMIDVIEWNDRETWTFAWNKPLEEYWFFGETAWGDQYAYRRDELRESSRPKVYFLQGITMNPEVIANDFDTFLEAEFLRNALEPYDSFLVAVRQRLGDLAPLDHIAYVPSLLISGEENVDLVSKLDAVASMVINGDLYNQLADQPQDRPIKELQPFEDADGRMRMRVVWA